jgi:hypothetical protein
MKDSELPPSYAPTTAVAYNTSAVNSFGGKQQTDQDIIHIPEDQVHAVSANPAEAIPQHTSTNTHLHDHLHGAAPPIKSTLVANSGSVSNPPGNCRDGGQWGTIEYIGNKTGALTCIGCLLCGIFGLFLLACPQDEKDAYSVDGKLYDASGAFITSANRNKSFVPTVKRGGRNCH